MNIAPYSFYPAAGIHQPSEDDQYFPPPTTWAEILEDHVELEDEFEHPVHQAHNAARYYSVTCKCTGCQNGWTDEQWKQASEGYRNARVSG